MDKNPTAHLSTLGIISKFLPLIWPTRNYKIKFSVIMAVILVMITIGLNISVPLVFTLISIWKLNKILQMIYLLGLAG